LTAEAAMFRYMYVYG